MNDELLKSMFVNFKFYTVKIQVSDSVLQCTILEIQLFSSLFLIFIQLNTVELNMFCWCEKGIRLEIILYFE